MTETTTQARKNDAFPMTGTLSNAEILNGAKGQYGKGTFAFTTAKGKSMTRTVMAFGKGLEAVRAEWTNGEHRLYVKFDGATLAVIGLGLPPKEKAAA